MHDTEHADPAVARLLAELPAFGRWANRPLNRQLKQLLTDMDEQTLMSLSAHALQRVTVGQRPVRRPPI